MFDFPLEKLMEGALIFIRIGGILFTLPIFGDQPISPRFRVLLAVAVGFCMAPIVPIHWLQKCPTDLLAFVFMVIREILIGIVIGFVGRIAFDGLVMAASICGYQMGFGTAGLLVPDAGQSLSGFEAFHRIVMILIFFSLNLHHLFFQAIVETFKVIPAGGAIYHADFGEYMTSVTAMIFSVAIQFGAPILIALSFTMTVLGLVARAVPQMNVFTMSFPISFFIGLLVYLATLPFFPQWISEHFYRNHENMLLAIKGLFP